MSGLIARVSEIQSVESLHIVKFECHEEIFSMMSLELDKSIKVGTRVSLVVKPSQIALAKEFHGDVSCSNRFNALIHSCNNGELLSSITLMFFDTIIESIITADSSSKMNLQEGDTVTALIKASDLSIGEILDD